MTDSSRSRDGFFFVFPEAVGQWWGNANAGTLSQDRQGFDQVEDLLALWSSSMELTRTYI